MHNRLQYLFFQTIIRIQFGLSDLKKYLLKLHVLNITYFTVLINTLIPIASPQMDENVSLLPNVRSRNSIFGTKKDGCWLYRWLHVHSFILFIRCFFKPITKEDTFNLDQKYWPETLSIEYDRLKYVSPFDSSKKMVFKMIKKQMCVACFLASLDAGLGFVGPILVKYILIYLNNPNPDQSQRHEAYVLSSLWIAFYLIKIFVREYWIRIAELAATKVQVLLEGQIYKKIMRLSAAYKKYINPGEFFSYWFMDVGVITSCIINFPTLVAAPTTLILAIIFVCIQIGAVGLLLLLVIVVALIVALIINWKMSKTYTHKLFYYYNRMSENVHMCSKFKQLKFLGWERILVLQNMRIRFPENQMNQKYYLLNQTLLFICNFTPYLIVVILMIVQYKLNSQSWTTTQIYTIISYIGVISGPLADLPSIIVKIFQYQDVFDRIDNFLQAQELNKTKDIYVQNGTIIIDNPIFSIGTMSSINRIIVKESLFIHKNLKYMKQGLKTMPFEVRLFHSLQFMSQQQTQKFCMHLKCINIPFKLKFQKGDRIVIISKKGGSGKTSFLRSFLGINSLQSGTMRYGGKVGYVGSNNLFLEDSIRQNVIFGEQYQEERLKIAYKISGLDQELQKFRQSDQVIVQNSSFILSRAQRALIFLARAIYYDCDILILDDFFRQFQIDQANQIYARIKDYFKNKVIIFTLKLLIHLQPSDKIIILENRVAVETGVYSELKVNPQSAIHKYKVRDFQLLHYQNIIRMKQKASIQNSQKSLIFSPSQSQVNSTNKNHFQKPILYLREYLQHPFSKQTPKPHLKPTVIPYKRPGKVQLKYYLHIFKFVGWIYLLILILIWIAVGCQTFGFWLIGSLNKSPFGLSQPTAIVLYACIQIGNGLFLFIHGLFLPRMVVEASERISNDLNLNLARTKLEEIIDPSAVQLMWTFGSDLQPYYTIFDGLNGVFINFAGLIATVFIMGIASYYIWIILGAVIIYTTICYMQYRRTYHETFVSGGKGKGFYARVLQNYVDGVESIQFYDKVQWFRSRIFDGIYFYCAQYKTNMNFVNHSFNILSGFGVLVIMAGILFLAVATKSKDNFNIIYANVAVSVAPRVLTYVTHIFDNLNYIAKNIHGMIKIPYQFFRGKIQEDFQKTYQKPLNWPLNGKIHLQQVIYERKERISPLLDSVNLTISSGQIVGVIGNWDNDISILFYLLNGILRPYTNDGRPAGKIFISDANISNIAQSDISQIVLRIDSFPVAFTGSIRFNVDPFNKYEDSKIQEALNEVKFWDQIYKLGQRQEILLDPQFGTLDFNIDQRGQYLSASALQKINIARVILKKPKIILLDRAFSKLDQEAAEIFYAQIRRVARNCTILHFTHKLNFLFRCDRMIHFKKGKIVEEGKPWELAMDPNSRLHKMLEQSIEIEFQQQKGQSLAQSQKTY